MQQIRAFIAVELPPPTRDMLAGVVQHLASRVDGSVRWSRPESLHLTLRFLGNIDVESVPAVSDVVSRCAASARPFELALGGIGGFERLRAMRVIWMSIAGDVEPLTQLYRAVEDELESLGFARERRAFRPHITLGRVRDGAPVPQRRAVADALAAVEFDAGPMLPVETIALIRSVLTPAGSEYTRLHTTRLGGVG
ncbi:MAG: RNA 2',3'-cyclic phosphodiesterase [Chloroflexota bacterium]|nr:RNA 2',3'-cyclic phosphodiesterase [Chloroflexota bacterium]MDE2941052.1 RNA 2',3'-cyclic phosphodiesterase [Chloroflexota bacterium]MDE3267422.1 RNA 2',3'-cyclic phosphodiesterase [Chloroflexota bacterium]